VGDSVEELYDLLKPIQPSIDYLTQQMS